jgi:hypothetical protein
MSSDERRVNMDEAMIRHVRRPATPTAAVPVLIMVMLFFSARSFGASDRVRLSLGVGYFTSGAGVDFGFLIRTWKTAGFQMSGLLYPGEEAGLLADLGVWKLFGPERTPTQILLGVSFVGVTSGDDENTGFGVHAGVHQELWFDRHFGLYGRGVLRFLLQGRESGWGSFYPSLSAGLTIRF